MVFGAIFGTLLTTLLSKAMSNKAEKRQRLELQRQRQEQQRQLAPYNRATRESLERYRRLSGQLGAEVRDKAITEEMKGADMRELYDRGMGSINKGYRNNLISSDRLRAQEDYKNKFKIGLADRALAGAQRLSSVSPKTIGFDPEYFKTITRSDDRTRKMTEGAMEDMAAAIAKKMVEKDSAESSGVLSLLEEATKSSG